jgi:hypothetical protein
LENRVNRRSNDKTVEYPADSSNKSQDIRNMSESQKLRKWVGVGYVATAALALIGGARADTPGTALVPRDGGNATDLSPVPGLRDHYGLQGQTPLLEFNPNRITPELLEHLSKFVEDPELHIRNVQQGIYEDETSSEPQEGQENKGKEHLSSNEEKLATLKAVAEKAGKNPELADRVRKLLEKKRQLSESERRRLDNPPIPVSNPVCLDVSNSQAQVTVEPVNPLDNPVPGAETRVDFFLNVRNGCPVVADTVAYDLTVTATCTEGLPPTATRTAKIAADPSTVGIGENSGMRGPQSMIARCTTYDEYGQPIASAPVDSITATVSADGYNQIGRVETLYSPSYTIPLKH